MTINFDDLNKVIELAERSDIESLEVVDGDLRINVVCRSPQSQPLQSQEPQEHTPHNRISDYTQDQSHQGDASTTTTSASADTLANGNSNTENASATIDAPMMGTFYRRPEPSADEFVHEGDSVIAGETLCVIEAMKIMHEVKAESNCTIDAILIEEGDVVEFGQALFNVS